MEYFLATIQVEKGFYSKLVLATDHEQAKKLATEFGSEKHGKQFKGIYLSETLKEPTAQ